VKASVNPSLIYAIIALLAIVNYFALCVASKCFQEFLKRTAWLPKKVILLGATLLSAGIGAGSVSVCLRLAYEVFNTQPLISCLIVAACILAPAVLFVVQNFSKKIEKK
jgi:hypothetical protein